VLSGRIRAAENIWHNPGGNLTGLPRQQAINGPASCHLDLLPCRGAECYFNAGKAVPKRHIFAIMESPPTDLEINSYAKQSE
jgi:hypothetical protein